MPLEWMGLQILFYNYTYKEAETTNPSVCQIPFKYKIFFIWGWKINFMEQ